MLFSRELPQKGKDSEGLQGFKLADIREQVKKCAPRKCHYCRRGGAHATCSHADCTKKFHIPCAVFAGALLSFFGSFNVHCSEHRPSQQVDPERVRDESCGICLCPAGRPDGLQVLCTPCCGHNFHKLCLQQMALSSGYFFTCPICRDKNNRSGFLRHVKKFGVFVPQRDASWETEPNAFSELLEHHSGCDQRYCLCSLGRQHMVKDHSDWGQLLCHSCASFGSHRLCAGSPSRLPWFCPDCENAFTNRRGAGTAAAPRRPTLRQLLSSQQRPATTLSMASVLAPEGGAPDWQRAMTMVDDPRQLLRFTWSRVTRSVTIRTRAVQHPKNPNHVIPSVRLQHAEWQLGARVVLSLADRGQAEQAALHGGRATVANSGKRKARGGKGSRVGRAPKGSIATLPASPGKRAPAVTPQPPPAVSAQLKPKRRTGRPAKRKTNDDLVLAGMMQWAYTHQRRTRSNAWRFEISADK
ncbi:PHD finger protein 7-like [Amphibalanus amphitrite]|uniref:PHD finger protein 7-like n=1 Tax=Amphibalanus amphitrite TaxID=1232801 RepID=UPI001C905637|nr:PHD finger protein 7-like [Amphibalanus amphitrite]